MEPLVAAKKKKAPEGEQGTFVKGPNGYVWDPKKHGRTDAGKFARKGTGKVLQKGAKPKATLSKSKPDMTAINDQIASEQDAERAQTEQERAAQTQSDEQRRAQRQAEDAQRRLDRGGEDSDLAARARAAQQRARDIAQAKAAAKRDSAAEARSLAQATAQRQRDAATAARDLQVVARRKQQVNEELAALIRQRDTAPPNQRDAYQYSVDQLTKNVQGLTADEERLTKQRDAKVEAPPPRQAQPDMQQGESAADVQALRDKVRGSRLIDDVARSSTRASEDATNRAAARELTARIAQRKREMSARHKAMRQGAKTASAVPNVALAAALRLDRHRCLVRAGLTADLGERAILQASAAAFTADLELVRAGGTPSARTAAGNFDGAVIVLLAHDGTVEYSDGDTAPQHVTLAYLGPADQMSDEDVNAATATTERIAAAIDPFTPDALSPARFGDDDVLLVEHPDIQRAHDMALMDPRVSALVSTNNEHPHFVPHCSGATSPPMLDRAALMLGGQHIAFPLGRARPPMTAAVGSWTDALHPRGKDGKWIEKFGLVDIFGLSGFQHGQRGDKRVEGQVTDITPDPKRPDDPWIDVKVTDKRWDPHKFGETVRVRRNQLAQRAPAKAHLSGHSAKNVVKKTPAVAVPAQVDNGFGGVRTPLVGFPPSPDGPNFKPLEPPANWADMDPGARNAWLKSTMEADYLTWRGPTTFDFSEFDSGVSLNLANSYRDLSNWDPDTAKRIDRPIVPETLAVPGGSDLGWDAIAVADPGTKHPGGIGPKIRESAIVLSAKRMSTPDFWVEQKALSDAQKYPWSTSAMTGDPTMTLAHEFGHQRQFRYLAISMGDVGKAWAPATREDGFGLIPDSSNWAETQALRYQIPELTHTKYGHSKSSEGFAEAWAERGMGTSTPELNDALDQWDEYMGVSLDLPTDRYDKTSHFDDLTPEQQDAWWEENGPALDLPGMRAHYPDSAKAYDAWVAKHQAPDAGGVPAASSTRAALDAAGLPEVNPMTRADFTAPDTPRTRPVTPEEFAALGQQGKARLMSFATGQEDAAALDGPTWGSVKNQGWDSVQTEWGGITVDTHTGELVDPSGADRWALTVKPPGTETVQVPIGSDRATFDAAMEQAKQRWAKIFRSHQMHLGVFRNDDIGMYEFDPVLVVDSHDDVESIGVYTHASGGAYNFADGLGYWPPYVEEVPSGGTAEQAGPTGGGPAVQGAGRMARAGPQPAAERRMEDPRGRGARDRVTALRARVHEGAP